MRILTFCKSLYTKIFRESFAPNWVIMKMFVKNCINLIWSLIIDLWLFDQILRILTFSFRQLLSSYRIQASHCNRQCFCKEEKERSVGYNKAYKKVLFGISWNNCIQWKWLYIILFQERQRKNAERLLITFPNF